MTWSMIIIKNADDEQEKEIFSVPKGLQQWNKWIK